MNKKTVVDREGDRDTVSASGIAGSSFAERINRLHSSLVRDGVPVADMRRAPALELQFAGAGEIGRGAESARPGFEPLEGAIASRRVPAARISESRLKYFLDGAQRTFSVWRCGLIPIAATVVAAGILQRDPGGEGSIAPGTLQLEHCLLIPAGLDSRVDDVRARIEQEGMRVLDPRDLSSSSDDVVDYGRLHELSYVAARRVRDELEARVLQSWVNRPEWAMGEDWLTVDGRLRQPSPRTLGLVKQFSDAYLSGLEAETLLSLPPGYRTTAFRPRARKFGADSEERSLWYLRLWDPSGLDARHALVRLEAATSVSQTFEIDEISSWILAERTPRAVADARWATLLYPVHLLERILKRRLDADTRGWPGA
jgi:hypothetical protein